MRVGWAPLVVGLILLYCGVVLLGNAYGNGTLLATGLVGLPRWRVVLVGMVTDWPSLTLPGLGATAAALLLIGGSTIGRRPGHR